MAGSPFRSSLSFPSSFPGAEDSPTPPAKRFSPSNPEIDITRGTQRKAVVQLRRSASNLSRNSSSAERIVEQFARYDLALRVYSAVQSGRLHDVCWPDAESKRIVYQLVFDVLYRKIRNKLRIISSNLYPIIFPDREVIEELLIESGFYSRNCDVSTQIMTHYICTIVYM